MTSYIVSTDNGGTFVDAVIWSKDTGRAWIGKASSTPDDPATGILNAVKAAAEIGGLPFDDVVKDMALFLNGTTVTTNAIIERKGARTGLLITAGFEDTLSIANVIGRTVGLEESELLDYRNTDAPLPIVPVNLVRGVIERVDSRGEVVVELDMESVKQALDELIEQGIEALAICLLWSFRYPAHERQIWRTRGKALSAFTVGSSDVPSSRIRRANSTAINASSTRSSAIAAGCPRAQANRPSRRTAIAIGRRDRCRRANPERPIYSVSGAGRRLIGADQAGERSANDVHHHRHGRHHLRRGPDPRRQPRSSSPGSQIRARRWCASRRSTSTDRRRRRQHRLGGRRRRAQGRAA